MKVIMANAVSFKDKYQTDHLKSFMASTVSPPAGIISKVRDAVISLLTETTPDQQPTMQKNIKKSTNS
ncbi:hypothetical protein L596_013817 [Steinernema carpocapsae]|uniref:Uncharacterized protein n=1 Tax=Steinernema carpocapsae TaxID=34508 RepID=A0A4U5P2J4_STECR|nr:hypothetical protein L596_013817 [Steinernema carpocapsae]